MPPKVFHKKSFLLKFRNIHKKASLLKSLLNKVAGNFLRIPILKEVIVCDFLSEELLSRPS